MVELLINKVIGEDWWEQYTGVQEEISANYVRDQLKAFPENEKELRIVIDSPGGDVFEGVTIFNIIRDFARNNPSVKITTYIQGMAASMASIIALAANAVNQENKIIAEDNSTYMIHNAWGAVVGNENDMREAADFFAGIDSMMRNVYMRKTGKNENDIRSMMDAETWLWGKNILEAGFVDEIIDGENNADESANMNDSLISARAEFKKSRELVNSMNLKRGGEALKRDWAAAAVAIGFKGGEPSRAEALASVENKKGGCMKITAEELKRDNPDVYDQVFQDGEAAGVKKEQARVNRLLTLGQKAGANDYALECIKSNAEPSDEKVIDAFMEKGAAAKALAAQAQDQNVPDVNPPKDDKNADKKAMNEAFDMSLNGGSDDGDN